MAQTWRFKKPNGDTCDPPPPPEPEPEGLFPGLENSELASFFLCCSAEERPALDPVRPTLEFDGPPGPPGTSLPSSPPGTRDRKQAEPGGATVGCGGGGGDDQSAADYINDQIRSALDSIYGAESGTALEAAAAAREPRRPPPLEAVPRRRVPREAWSPPVRPKGSRAPVRRSKSQRPSGGATPTTPRPPARRKPRSQSLSPGPSPGRAHEAPKAAPAPPNTPTTPGTPSQGASAKPRRQSQSPKPLPPAHVQNAELQAKLEARRRLSEGGDRPIPVVVASPPRPTPDASPVRAALARRRASLGGDDDDDGAAAAPPPPPPLPLVAAAPVAPDVAPPPAAAEAPGETAAAASTFLTSVFASEGDAAAGEHRRPSVLGDAQAYAEAKQQEARAYVAAQQTPEAAARRQSMVDDAQAYAEAAQQEAEAYAFKTAAQAYSPSLAGLM